MLAILCCATSAMDAPESVDHARLFSAAHAQSGELSICAKIALHSAAFGDRTHFTPLHLLTLSLFSRAWCTQ
jgi:hypothetical protein